MDTSAQHTATIVGNLSWDGLQKKQLRVAMAALLCGLFFSVMDGTVCNVALPILAKELSISSSNSIWIVNAFQLVIVMTLLPFAVLGELYSYKKIYLYGMLIFTLGSLCCALSTSFQWLIGARVLQGVGASMVMSINTSLVKLIYPKRHLGKGLGLNATIVALGLVVGPAFTGAVLSVTTWHWLFVVNLPFGILTYFLAKHSLPENPTRVIGRTFNWKEACLNALTLGLFIGCFEAFSHHANGWVTGLGFLLWLLVTLFYIRNQKQKAYPMLPLDLLQKPIFTLSILTSIVSFIAQMVALVGMPFLLTHTFGFDTTEMGLLMTSYPIVILFVAPISGLLIGKVHPELLGCLGLLALCVGSFLLATMPADTTFWGIVWRFTISGVGFGFFQSPNNHLIITAAPSHRSGSASGMMALARLMGQTLGAACVALTFTLFSDDGPVAALYLGGTFSFIGLLFSFIRYNKMLIFAKHTKSL